MYADAPAVYKNLGSVICRLEIKQYSPAALGRKHQLFLIDAGVHKVAVPYARKLALGAERHIYFLFKMCRLGHTALARTFSEIKIKFPLAAEILPAFADKLGARIEFSLSHFVHLSENQVLLILITRLCGNIFARKR